MKKKFFAVFFALLVLCTAVVPVFADEADDWDFSEEYPTAEPTGVTINVYNWGEYISNGTEGSLDVNAEFTRRTGIEVNYTTFDSNESLYSKLAGGGASYDVIVPSDYMISKLMNENMLAELDFSNIPNFEYIDEQFRNPDYDPENKFSVPYTWGTVGLFYNTDYVTEPVTSWSILWDEQYSGKILMFDNPRDAFAIAQERLGFSLNSTDESEWEQAAMLLKEQKPLVQAYVMDQIFDKMESGEAWLAPYYSGDAGTLVENNENSWIEEFAQENLITEKMREMREDREGKELQLKDEFNRASIFSDLRTCFSQIKEKTRFQVPAVIQAQEVEQIAMINSEIGRDWQTKGYDITEVRDEQIAVMNNLYPYEIVYMKFGKYIDLTNGEQTEQQLRMVFR